VAFTTFPVDTAAARSGAAAAACASCAALLAELNALRTRVGLPPMTEGWRV
jgi:hypothetical protein